MDRSVGWGAATLIAVAAFLGIARQAGNNQPLEVPAKQTATSQLHGKTSSTPLKGTVKVSRQFDNPGCEKIEAALEIFWLVPDKANVAAPATCEDSNHQKLPLPLGINWSKAAGAHYMIALLPDPIHTHLAGLFDQTTEAIGHAAQAEGFNLDSSWLPWEDPESDYLSRDDNEKSREKRIEQQQEPGVLLFRGKKDPTRSPYENALIVFVVGEKGTAGVNKAQFLNAVAWITTLESASAVKNTSGALTILGPASSGAFASLAQLLDAPPPGSSISSVSIASGTVSDIQAIQKFQDSLAGKPLVKEPVVSFFEDTTLQVREYLRLLALDGYDPQKVAVVAEDDTAFGQQSLLPLDVAPLSDKSDPSNNADPLNKTDISKKVDPSNKANPLEACEFNADYCRPGLTLSYPRDLPNLRNTYQKQGLLSPQTSQAQYADRQRLLSEDLSETGEESNDDIKNYSGSQADLKDEGELLQIVAQLKAKQIENVVLICSNPLDQMFLARFLRSADPSVRVVIADADQADFREQSLGEMRGVLTLSAYPLSTIVQAWTSPTGDINRPIFTSQGAQGTYYAARFLMEKSGASSLVEYPLPGYASPFWFNDNEGQRPPPTWLSVISGGQPWPVAVLDDETDRKSVV